MSKSVLEKYLIAGQRYNRKEGHFTFLSFLKKQHLRISLYFTEIDAGVFLQNIAI